jgi:Putative homoserine kinase type II (protein kinase fold)
MSVYTTVTPEELAGWLTRYAIGAVHEFEPISAGIENTNYFVTADKGRYVLTLYERLPAEELPFYLNLIAHLASAGVQAPAPEPDRSGALWSILNGKTRRIGRPTRRRRSRATGRRALRGCRRGAGADARGGRQLSLSPVESPRPRLVAPGRARRPPVPLR